MQEASKNVTARMPGMDRLQLLGEIKQRCPDLPVLMVTAYGDDERRRHARRFNAFDLSTEPVDFDHLKARWGNCAAQPTIPLRAP
jgi:DNA-binding NtrC family response regulator